MKRLISLAVLFLYCVATSFAQFTGSGSGTESDPYKITNPIQLNQIRNYLSKPKVYFRLENDIDLAEFIEDEYPNDGWLPIGTESSYFMGILDGNGKTISGLIINRPSSDNVGLFASLSSATIKNLSLVINIKGNNYVGGIVGFSNGTISNCEITGTIYGINHVGGLCGELNGNLSYCTSSANIHSTGSHVGGLVGGDSWPSETKRCNITYSYVRDVIVEGCDFVGGLAGFCNSITNSGFIGTITGNSRIGGLAGSNWNISNSFAMGKINATGDEVGGIVGYCGSSCYDSYFCGTVCGKMKVGGLLGNIDYPSKVSRCYSKASVIGESKVGGLFGVAGSRYIEKNVFMGSYVKSTISDVGRVYGYLSDSYGLVGELGTNSDNKSYNKTIVIKAGVAQNIESSEQNGTGVSETTLKLKATYVAMGWDFTDIWDIQETECYPYFKWQTAPPIITSQVVSGATIVSGNCVDGGVVTLEIDGMKQQMFSTGNNGKGHRD